MIGLRLPKEETARLDQWAKANGYTRTEAIRAMIERGLRGDPDQPIFGYSANPPAKNRSRRPYRQLVR